MKFVWEHNGSHTLLYCADYPGAFTRGENLEIAKGKMQGEMESYCRWRKLPNEIFEIEIVQDAPSQLQIADADSEVLFNSEKAPLSMAEYEVLKALVLKSAEDFHALYDSIPSKTESVLPCRRTFYGEVPRTAQAMYDHTRSVNAYYFGEIGIEIDNDGTILDCRRRGLDKLEQSPNFLSNPVFHGSYGELWSLRKVFRRFLWHDRIHAKAMYRMGLKTFGSLPKNSFCF